MTTPFQLAQLMLIARAYDDGVAFRYELPRASKLGEFTLTRELTEFVFAGDYRCWAGEPSDCAENNYPETTLSRIPQQGPGKDGKATPYLSTLPLTVQAPMACVAVAESDLLDWAGMFFTGTGTPKVSVTLAPRGDGRGCVVSRAPRASPWRVLMIGHTAAEFKITQTAEVLGTRARELAMTVVSESPLLVLCDHLGYGDLSCHGSPFIKTPLLTAAGLGAPFATRVLAAEADQNADPARAPENAAAKIPPRSAVHRATGIRTPSRGLQPQQRPVSYFRRQFLYVRMSARPDQCLRLPRQLGTDSGHRVDALRSDDPLRAGAKAAIALTRSDGCDLGSAAGAARSSDPYSRATAPAIADRFRFMRLFRHRLTRQARIVGEHTLTVWERNQS